MSKHVNFDEYQYFSCSKDDNLSKSMLTMMTNSSFHPTTSSSHSTFAHWNNLNNSKQDVNVERNNFKEIMNDSQIYDANDMIHSYQSQSPSKGECLLSNGESLEDNNNYSKTQANSNEANPMIHEDQVKQSSRGSQPRRYLPIKD